MILSTYIRTYSSFSVVKDMKTVGWYASTIKSSPVPDIPAKIILLEELNKPGMGTSKIQALMRYIDAEHESWEWLEDNRNKSCVLFKWNDRGQLDRQKVTQKSGKGYDERIDPHHFTNLKNRWREKGVSIVPRLAEQTSILRAQPCTCSVQMGLVKEEMKQAFLTVGLISGCSGHSGEAKRCQRVPQRNEESVLLRLSIQLLLQFVP